MGLMQKAVETYDANIKQIGIYKEGHEPLAPVCHTLTSANIEITLSDTGAFLAARKIDKSEPKIIIPITEESDSRTNAPVAHPLCDQLKYIASKNKEENTFYIEALTDWIKSDSSHPFLTPILSYVKGNTIISDLKRSGTIAVNDNGEYDEQQFVCWRINGFDDENPACWKNQNLFKAFIQYYNHKISASDINICMISGANVPVAKKHPKKIIPINGNAKLISANDDKGFTYRGRFCEEWQAATIGYITSQKAHNALRWLASEQGVREFSGNRIFLCWNPQGKKLPKPMRGLRASDAEPITEPSDYKDALQRVLRSIQKDNQFIDNETAVLTAFDAATKGRLSVTYYSEISLRLFLDRMKIWDEHCCWYLGPYGIQAPNLLQIIECAFGTNSSKYLEVDNRIQRQHLQRLLDCKVNGGVFPIDIVRALVQRASTPLAFHNSKIWRRIVHSACSVLQKYRYDTNQGGNEMSWELNKNDRSFQFGRLLAVLDRAEADYYNKTEETRQTNAIKYMSEYCQRPWYVFERVNRQLHQAYLNRIEAWQAIRYEHLVGEIVDILKDFPEDELNKPLDSVYLMGYELQRNAFYEKTIKENVTEE